MNERQIPESDVVDRYVAGESAASLARAFSVNIWTILNRLRRNGVTIRSPATQNARFLGDTGVRVDRLKVEEVLAGVLLGDGYLNPKGSLFLEQSVRRFGWLLKLQRDLDRIGCESRLIPLPAKTKWLSAEQRFIYGKEGALLYTPCYQEFKEQRKRWYPDARKVVPDGLKLTPTVVAHWFCGDGTCGPSGSLTLLTNSFTRAEVERLCQALEIDLGVKASISKNGRDEHVLQILRRQEAVALAGVIRPLMPKCCLYKLRFVRPLLRELRHEP